MKTNLNSLSLLLCVAFLIVGCDFLGKEHNNESNVNFTIKPAKLDMNGVHGFAVIENDPTTRADGDSSSEGTAPYSLYSIDENGNIFLSIFHFDIIVTEGDDGTITETQIKKEISNAVQVVPNLVTDFGKYILFSHCRYTLNETVLSEEAIEVCREFIESKNLLYPDNQTYMIRKSDGALFDLSGQDIFEYRSIQDGHENLYYIPPFRYLISPSGDLYSMKYYYDGYIHGVCVYKISDNGNALDVRQVTQWHDSGIDHRCGYRLGVDVNDNVYLAEVEGNVHVYFSDGLYSVLPPLGVYLGVIDFQADDSGNLYLFRCSHRQGGMDTSDETTIYALKLDRDNYIVRDTLLLSGDYLWFTWDVSADGPNGGDKSRPALKYPRFIGYSDNTFSWVIMGCINAEDYLHQTKKVLIGVLSYNTVLDEWTYEDKTELAEGLLEGYDIVSYGVKCYGVNVGESSVEVTEVDVIESNSRTYTLDAPIPSSVLNEYCINDINGVPYLMISGHSIYGGFGTSFTMNLINGENNASFGSDSRKVVSFFRIN